MCLPSYSRPRPPLHPPLLRGNSRPRPPLHPPETSCRGRPCAYPPPIRATLPITPETPCRGRPCACPPPIRVTLPVPPRNPPVGAGLAPAHPPSASPSPPTPQPSRKGNPRACQRLMPSIGRRRKRTPNARRHFDTAKSDEKTSLTAAQSPTILHLYTSEV